MNFLQTVKEDEVMAPYMRHKFRINILADILIYASATSGWHRAFHPRVKIAVPLASIVCDTVKDARVGLFSGILGRGFGCLRHDFGMPRSQVLEEIAIDNQGDQMRQVVRPTISCCS